VIESQQTYHAGSRELQDRFDTRRIADRIDELLVHDTISPHDREFIERLDMFVLATADEHGTPDCSYKGGAPGFVRVPDDRTLASPSYDSNGMFRSLGNILRNPEVGMLFIDIERGHRMRVNGTASIDLHDEALSVWPEAQLVVRVRTRQVFPNCPRYVHRYQRVRNSRFVPRPGEETPVPAWKRAEWAVDALPAGDPACDPTREVLDR
jgi:predicted pyridoxine 5'-phosphate oxidase superfamily flavin-nucleotide-binding protein